MGSGAKSQCGCLEEKKPSPSQGCRGSPSGGPGVYISNAHGKTHHGGHKNSDGGKGKETMSEKIPGPWRKCLLARGTRCDKEERDLLTRTK